MGFTQGVSGLRAAAADLDSIGNNIANSQTNGYKSGSTQFADIYANARTGLGVAVAGTVQDFSTGTLSATDRNLDVAIDGRGFFRQIDNGRVQYSRDGQFQQTREGYLANSSGALLTGYNAQNVNDPDRVAGLASGGTPEIIQLPAEGLSARATTRSALAASLDAGAPIKPGADFDPSESTTYDWSTPSTVFDSLGNAHSLNLYFTRTASNQWQVNADMPLGDEANLPASLGQSAPDNGFALDLSAFRDAFGNAPGSAANGTYRLVRDDGSVYTARVQGSGDADGDGRFTGGTIGYTQSLPASQLSFDTAGRIERAVALDANGQAAGDTTTDGTRLRFGLDAQNGSAPIDFVFDFANATQTAQAFSAGNPSQNGYAAGALTGIAVQDDGRITGSYDNGQTLDLARIALAGFRNENGLQPVSGNAWIQTAASGEPALGTAGTGAFGDLRGATLEGSNVDLSQELVDMIVSQRNYQANAQTIKTQDQILQTAVNLR